MTSYCLAPEWERQDAVILVWPHTYSDWGNKENGIQLKIIENTYIELSRYISRKQNLIIIVYNNSHLKHVHNCLIEQKIKFENISFIKLETNDTWVRDYGPVFVHSNTGNTILNFEFNAWGNKYPHIKDNAFNQALHEKVYFNSDFVDIDFILEAGNIDINNKGYLLSSSSCFKRAPLKNSVDLLTLEKNFKQWFGCEHILWIDNIQLAGDDTDGHIDNLARFSSDEIILHSSTSNLSDENKSSLDLLTEQLREHNKQNTNSFELVPVPLPSPIFHNNVQLPASYINFLITNEYVHVPVFNDKHDNIALKLIDECFPSREIIDIEGTALIQQFGGIHCASMQVPEGFLT